MPHSPLHKQQKKKNYAILLALLVFVVTVFFVSIIRMKGG
jgi:hypothetical protein